MSSDSVDGVSAAALTAAGVAIGAVAAEAGAPAFASFSILEKSGGPFLAPLAPLAPLAALAGAGAPAWVAGDGEAEDLTCMAKRSRSLG